MPRLQGLTTLQKTMCERLWNLESEQDIIQFRKTLPKRQQQVCDEMLRLIVLECLDEEVTTYDDCAEARDLLSSY
jgi:hypothetical protein